MYLNNEEMDLTTVEALYRKLNINIIETVNIEMLSKEYHESMMLIEREAITTSAYNNR